MKHKLLLPLSVAALLMFISVGYGHHSLGATYLADQEIKLEGRLVQFVYRNPHSFVHIEAKGADGSVKRWAVEWTGAAALAGQGIQGNSLKPGDQVVIMGRPSRSPGETRALMRSLWRPSDDFRWGSRPNEVVD
jgi:hypothetical protein